MFICFLISLCIWVYTFCLICQYKMFLVLRKMREGNSPYRIKPKLQDGWWTSNNQITFRLITMPDKLFYYWSFFRKNILDEIFPVAFTKPWTILCFIRTPLFGSNYDKSSSFFIRKESEIFLIKRIKLIFLINIANHLPFHIQKLNYYFHLIFYFFDTIYI